jgi:hypothetical protein
MHLAGIDHDGVAGRRLHRADTAPGALGTVEQDPHSELVMRMARKASAGHEAEGLDTGQG